ncbi:trypsin-like peptidase domain-containing protein [Bacillus sp. FJAT-29814]|uniref:trypsin-like peptidase domain-containing protein n=1 Tax=Bacillus sp. FJAT-29814 TaxID=1729688 RepID=UPI000829C9F0|nr:trypsin-like peptidase domain-containing protein [Bacillus sp. FJAT-29814]
MKKRALFTIPLSLLLIAAIVASFFLINIKPATGDVKQAQRLNEYTKPAVVRIIDYAVVKWQFLDYNPDVQAVFERLNYQTLIGGSGSGAVISADGYVVTNAHVVEFGKMENQAVADAAFEQLVAIMADYFQVDFNEAYDYLVAWTQYTGIQKATKVILPGGDVLDGETKSYGAPINEGKDVAVVKIEGKNLPTIPLGNSDDIESQQDIWVSGYPAAADSDLLSPDSSLVSTMNAGQISATDKKTEQGSPVIQINAAATHGNSGGPVINEDGEIIGLLTFRGDTVNGQEVQGFNFAVPVNTVTEFVNQAGVRDTKSDTDRLYKEGLDLYWGGYYKHALEKFEAVQRIYPNHSEIKEYISKSEKKMGESKTLWADYAMMFYIGDGVAGLLVLILLVFTFVGGRSKGQAGTAVLSGAGVPVAGEGTGVGVGDAGAGNGAAGGPQTLQVPPGTQTGTHQQEQAPQQGQMPQSGQAPPAAAEPETNIADLNKDGKVDIQDILLALEEHQKRQKKNEE